jgi:hypothetical protein
MIEAIWKAKFQKVKHPKRFTVEKNELVEVHPGQSTEAHNPAYTAPKETRQQKWRRLYPEKYRAGQAALMRKRRAAK